MKKKHVLKAAAFVLASSFVCTSASINIRNINYEDAAYDTARKIQPVTAEIVPEEERWSVEEQLTYASKGKDDTELLLICDGIIDDLNKAKEKVEADCADLAQWADPEIVERQKEYEEKFNVKYEETVQALNNVRKGIDTEENIGIIAGNLSPEKEIPGTYAASSGSVQAADIEYMEDIKVGAADVVSYDPTEDDLNCEKDIIDKETFVKIADEIGGVDDIYHFLKNNVKNEMYKGSKKGPLLTFFQLGGNDVDQASLLISLLRVKNIPARFVRGNVRITLQQAYDLTGASDPDAVSRILALSYDKVTGLRRNGEVVAYSFDHTWAEAYIPYTDYRGAGNKSGDSVWIQLDPSFKKLVNTKQEIDASYKAEQLSYLNDLKKIISESPEVYGNNNAAPEKITLNYSDIEAKNEIYIPSSLPYQVNSIAERYDFIKDKDKQTISFSVDGERLFSSPVAELYGCSVNVSYEPASDKDKEAIAHYKKLTDVPAQAVRVVPVITVGDKKYIAKNADCPLGTQQQLSTSIKDDTGTTTLNDILLSGSVYAITLDLNMISSVESEIAEQGMKLANEKRGTDELFSAEVLGQVLGYAGKYYFTLCDQQNQFHAITNNVNYTRHMAAAITGYQFQTSETFGMTSSLETGNFYIDAEYNRSSVVSLDGDRDIERKYNFETGIIESKFEGEVWNDIIGTDKPGISTMHIMEAAIAKGIEPLYIVKRNADEMLAKCNIDSYIKSNVRNSVNSGNLVIIIPEILTIGDWVGTAYIDMEPDTAAATYMISDGTAGGASQDIDLETEDLDITDKLFTLNIRLSYVNRALAVAGVAKCCAGLITAEEGNIGAVVDNILGMFISTTAYAGAVQMELNLCDIVLDYGEGKLSEEELEKALAIETRNNLVATLVNLLTLVNVNSNNSTLGSEIVNLMTSVIGLVGADDSGSDDNDGISDMSTMLDCFLHTEYLIKIILGI